MFAMLVRYKFVIAVNILLLAAMLGAVEGYYRHREKSVPPEDPKNALWQVFRPYTMFSTITTHYTGWQNQFTKETIKADVTNNDLGFRDDRTFSPIST